MIKRYLKSRQPLKRLPHKNRRLKITNTINTAIKKTGAILLFLFFYQLTFSQQQDESITKYGFQNELVVSNELSCFIDTGNSLNFQQIQLKQFDIAYPLFLKKIKSLPNKNSYWLKFSIQNNTDSSLQPFFDCGDFDFISLYLVSPHHPLQQAEGGNLAHQDKSALELERMSLTLPLMLAPRQEGDVYIKIIQKTPEYYLNGIGIYKQNFLDNSISNAYYQNRYSIVWDILFQGFLLCQILYVLFQWIIIRRKEYVYYFLYLIAIVFYFLSRREAVWGIPILFSRYPAWTIYLNKTLQILPYFLYYRFVRYFLEIRKNYPALYKWIIRLEYFLLAYLVFDFLFITSTYNTFLETKIFICILVLVFIITAAFIIYLFRQKQPLIYFVMMGSLFVGLGNILGVLFSFLVFREDFQLGITNMLVFSQIGIVLEILCFTSGLSYKSKLIEEEKLSTQQNLVKQLKANEMLNAKMQNIRNKIAFDLHDEIGSTLSSISILSEMALQKKKDAESAGIFKEIKENSIIVMERMDDIVWSINPNNDSMENLFLRIKSFAAKLFEAREISYKIEIDQNINYVDVLMEFRQHIYLIMKEAINNLVKYSGCTEAGIFVSYHSSLLTIIIKDNGKGYDVNSASNGNGLNSMRKRAEEMNAEIDMQSKINEGTIIKLSVKN